MSPPATRKKRIPLLLNLDYPIENVLHRAIRAVPVRDRAAFARALAIIGHRAMKENSGNGNKNHAQS